MDNAKTIAYFTTIRDQATATRDQAIAALAELTAPAPVPTPVPAVAGRAPDNPTGTVPGLNFSYYEGPWSKLPDYSTLKPVAAGTAPQPGIVAHKSADHFGLRFVGFVTVPTDGEYTFVLNSDDGSKLYIGTTLVVSNDGTHGPNDITGKIKLQKGTHAITVDYFEYEGDQSLSVAWAGPNLPQAIIPASAYSRIAATTSGSPAPVGNFTAQPNE